MPFDDDKVARLALYPKFLHRTSGVFDIETLLAFHSMEKGRWYAMSVVNRAVLTATEDVHRYGCRAALHADATFERTNSRPPDTLEEETHYLGFYEFRWGSVRQLPSDLFEITLRWKPENGEDDHFQIELVLKRGVESSKKTRRDDMVALRAMLGMLAAGPVRHICERDEAVRAGLEAIDLPQQRPAEWPLPMPG